MLVVLLLSVVRVWAAAQQEVDSVKGQWKPQEQFIDIDPQTKILGLDLNVIGFFYSGGGYVSHGEGAVLTWGWNKYFHKEGGLTDLLSDTVVSTTSGGGWFFTDLVYVPEFQEVVSADTTDEFLDKISEYYYELIAHFYDLDVEKVKKNTNNGRFNLFSPDDMTAMMIKFHTWQEVIKKYHYRYEPKPTLSLTHCNWTSTFGVAQKFNNKDGEYYLKTGVKGIDDPQRSSRYSAIPANFDFQFETPFQNPKISSRVDTLDHWWTRICIEHRTSKRCIKKQFPFGKKKEIPCMENAWCDKDLELCICNNGFSPQKINGKVVCTDCWSDGSVDWDACMTCEGDEACEGCAKGYDHSLDPITELDVTWHRDLQQDQKRKMKVAEIHELVEASVHEPWEYSGPSSAAGAMMVTNSDIGQDAAKAMHFETSWLTSRMKNDFNDDNAPSLSLIDGGGQDNCAITAQVRQQQLGLTVEELKDAGGTIVGMCSVDEVLMLISGTTGKDKYPKLYEIFEFAEGHSKAELQWEGKVMKVWGFEVVTIWDSSNGIRHGTPFTIIAFEFPGLGRNIGMALPGYEKYTSNFGKDPKDYKPVLSLMPGKGEVFELNIALRLALSDMQSLAEHMACEQDPSCKDGFCVSVDNCEEGESCTNNQCTVDTRLCKGGHRTEGKCDPKKKNEDEACNKCANGYRWATSSYWCCTDKDLKKYNDCACQCMNNGRPGDCACVPNGRVSGKCDKKKTQGEWDSCYECEKGFRQSGLDHWCCHGKDISKGDCICKESYVQYRAEYYMEAFAAPEEALPTVTVEDYGLWTMAAVGLAATLYAATSALCCSCTKPPETQSLV